jgi:hypothetical protein
MQNRKQLFHLIYNIFFGFFLSTLYGALTAMSLFAVGQSSVFKQYLEAFFVQFNGALAGGLVLATAITVYRTQDYVPERIEDTFTRPQLNKTSYFEWKAEFYDLRKTIIFSSEFAIAGILIFYAAKFPFEGVAEAWLIAGGSLSYAVGVYVGRKLFHIAHMLRALEAVQFKRDIFHNDELGGVSTYVNAVTTLAAVMIYVCVRCSYYGPFEYESVVGNSIKSIMLLPAVIALPVLALFNYYPRVMVRKLYRRSIDNARQKLERDIKRNTLSDFERLSFVLEFDRISRDELNYRLRMTLADLPMAATMGVALLSVLRG